MRRLGQKGDLTTYRAEEVPVGERSDIIAAYRAKAGREVNGYFTKLPADVDHPVFRLTPWPLSPRSPRPTG